MKKQESKHKKAYNLIYLLLTLLLLSWILLWGRNSFFSFHRGERKKAKMQSEIQRSKAEIDSLKKENNRLRTDPAAAEKVGREEFGLIKPGETIWRFKTEQPTQEQEGNKDKK